MREGLCFLEIYGFVEEIRLKYMSYIKYIF